MLIHIEHTDVCVAIEEPPFEVTETGWGEFEIQIKVHFIPEASEKPMTLFHFLHLHPYGANKEEEREKGLTVEAFQYEEIVSSPSTFLFSRALYAPCPRCVADTEGTGMLFVDGTDICGVGV